MRLIPVPIYLVFVVTFHVAAVMNDLQIVRCGVLSSANAC
jgi:hypothetical protein